MPDAPATDAGYLQVLSVAKRFRDMPVLAALDLLVGRGELVSLLGPSGCGKTTLLRVVAGLLRPDGGQVILGGRDLTPLPAHRRNVGVVFQSYALFPHLTVAENVAFGLARRGESSARIAQAVRDSLALVRLEGFGDRAVTALSGGQQQRVAMARALAPKPDLILLDEPLSALDRKLRETMQVELRRLLKGLGMTAIFVTHDQDEALALSDRIAVMNHGRIEQYAPAEAVYAQPATPFVLEFVGLSTRLAGRVVDCTADRSNVATRVGPVQVCGRFTVGTAVLVGVRPERIRLGGEPGGSDENVARATVTELVYQGGSRLVRCAGGADDDELVVEIPGFSDVAVPAAGETVTLRWSVADGYCYRRD